MVMEGQGSDWAWLALRILGRDASVDECNQWLETIFVDDEHPPGTLVDANSLEQASKALRQRGIQLPTQAEIAEQSAARLLATKEGRRAIRDHLREMSKSELSELLQVEIA